MIPACKPSKDFKNILQLVREYGRLEIHILNAHSHDAVQEFAAEAKWLFKLIKRELKALAIWDKNIISDEDTKIIIAFIKSKLSLDH